MVAAAKLAAEGKYRCRFCNQVKTTEEGIVTSWGGNVLFALCAECHPGRPIVMRVQHDSQGRKGVFVGFLNEADIPSKQIVVASDLSSADVFKEAGLSKFKPTNWWEEEE